MPIRFDLDKKAVFDSIIPAIASFKAVFGRDISPDFLAELYVARELDLELPDESNKPGADAISFNGERYEIKYRSTSTLNVDVNNFDFDNLVLVNLDKDYHLIGLWLLPVDKARKIFVFREKFRKYQATQEKVKLMSTRLK